MNFVLLVDHDGDCDPPAVYGVFTSLEDAQSFAEKFREAQGLPIKANPENNEEWTDAGWYFGIFTPIAPTDKSLDHLPWTTLGSR